MYVSPNHPDKARLLAPPAEPVENGQRLGTFNRSHGEELRVNLSEYQGSPFVALRVWSPGANGVKHPVAGKGCSLRMREIPELLGIFELLVKQPR